MGLILYCEKFSEKEVISCISEIFEAYPQIEIILLGNNCQIEVRNKITSSISEVCGKVDSRADYQISIEKVSQHLSEVDEWNEYEYNSYDSSVTGVQPKDFNKNGNIVKVDSSIKEGLNESLAYLISECTPDLDFVKYTSCIVDIGNRLSTGCISTHLSKYGVKNYMTLDSLLSCNAVHLSNLSREECIQRVSALIDYKRLFKLLAFDILVCNTDRHLGNICIEHGQICAYQYDNGQAFASGVDCNIFTDEYSSILNNCVFKPFDFTLTSFIEKYRSLNIEPLRFDRIKLDEILHETRSILYNPRLISRRLMLFEYQLKQTEGVLWKYIR